VNRASNVMSKSAGIKRDCHRDVCLESDLLTRLNRVKVEMTIARCAVSIRVLSGTLNFLVESRAKHRASRQRTVRAWEKRIHV